MDNVLKFINNLNINENDTVVVSCSYGPDSMYMLYIMHTYYKCKVVCAHVNHKMRQASEQEYIDLKSYCDKNSIIFEGTEILNYEECDNFHEYARNFRYEYFESVVKKYHAKYLFTAHHGDDLMETILMHILRGGSIYGYSGFDFIVDKGDYKIVRPLVYLSKAEIEKYDKILNIPYAVDESNLEDHYTRNRFRHHVLPFFKSEEKDAHLKFLNFASNLKECTNFLDNYVYSIIDKIYVDKVLDLNEFKNLDIYIKKEVIYKILMRIYNNNLSLINSNHVKNILTLIESDKPSVSINIPNNICILKEYDKLIFNYNNNISTYDYVLTNEVITPYGKIAKVSATDDTSNNTIRLNSLDIVLPIHVRCKCDGDKMQVKNMTGSKKISDIFIDSKIPKQERNTYPIVTDHKGKVLWIPGIKKSKFDMAKDKVYDIILKYEKGEK